MINKILIANRGEIAVRLVRACKEMGIVSVAVFTDADRHALHVKKADEAYNIGSDAAGGYLNAPHLVNLAVATKCDAIHPGYGFLSENPLLAEICLKRGIVFIGPNPDVIRMMGDKTKARELAISANVPVVPGSTGIIATLTEAEEWANKIGYPVMLKAANGGGGRGIRRVNSASELKNQYERVRSETEKAFGSAEIFVEKCVVSPKHIEVQILCDKFGHAIHLFERDCSIQRRHQKLIEISPSPQISTDLRDRLTDSALALAQAVNYENAGTVEFLLDENENFYFMEMNTRLQVEHTITEQITGIDIVCAQINIASGKALELKQSDIQYRGYAMQFRVNAEDPKNDFLPSFGKVTRYYSPGGPGVRTDSAIYTGYEIPPYYDSMCAKLTVWALDWSSLLARAQRALHEMGVFGVKTTIPYYLEILENKAFIGQNFTTSFIEENAELLFYSTRTRPSNLAAVIAAAIAAHLGD